MFKKPETHNLIKSKRRLGRKGFTLTELLVVIVIIGVLIALLFPTVTYMRERARSAKCVQNLRQIGIGMHAHLSENNGRFPMPTLEIAQAANGGIVDGRYIVWYEAAAENMGREFIANPRSKWKRLPDAFGCPSGYGKAYINEIEDGEGTIGWPYTGDYAVNTLLGNPTNALNPMTLSAVKNPGSTPYVQDTVKQNNFGPNIFSSGFSETAGTAFAARHNGKGNVLWVDGHVSSMTYVEYRKMANSSKYGGPTNFMRGDW
jgi:prepilin-type N-terminal cleavage/methylation domain-containing protein/prepilin-type processing-associated H-X9-DG protein